MPRTAANRWGSRRARRVVGKTEFLRHVEAPHAVEQPERVDERADVLTAFGGVLIQREQQLVVRFEHRGAADCGHDLVDGLALVAQVQR